MKHAAYLAGLFDGEGSVILERRSKNDKYRTPALSLPSTSRELIDWCLKETGFGCIVTKKRNNPNHSPCWTWKVHGNAVLTVLEQMLPYMVEKEKIRRANLLIKHYKNLTRRNGKYSKEEAELKIAFENEFLKNSRKVSIDN